MAHLTAVRIQGFLEGHLPAREVADVQRHVTSCSSCQADLSSWQLLFSELKDLERLEPSAGFHAGVLARLDPGADEQLHAMLTALARFSPSADFTTGVMAKWRAQAGTATSQVVDAEVEALLAGLGHFHPSPAFSRSVLRQVAVPGLARGAHRKRPVSIAALVRKAAAFAGATVPRTRNAWAVVMSGVAVTPLSVLALLAYAVFSKPLATPANLAHFAWWQVTGAASLLGEWVRGLLLDSSLATQGYLAFEYVGSSSPLMATGGALSFAFLTCGALLVLYKNLLPTPVVEQSHARIAA